MLCQRRSQVRGNPITSVLMLLGNACKLAGKVIRSPTFILTVILMFGIYITTYFRRHPCEWLRTIDSFGFQRKHFIYVNFNGRLGNLMFQYAFLYTFAKKKDLAMIFPNQLELTDIFQLNVKSFGEKQNLCQCCLTTSNSWDCAHDEKLENLTSQNDWSIQGYFQSWKYFKGFENELREQFKFINNIKEKAVKQLRDIFTRGNISVSNTVIVGVHIRRGDFVQPNIIKFGKKVPDENYFKNATEYFRNRHKQVLFIACSDNITYTKQILSKYHEVHIVRGNSAAEDIAILSFTNHTIMSVGTFGWWADFRTNGTTIYYKNPYTEGSAFSRQFKSLLEHFYPSWIPME